MILATGAVDAKPETFGETAPDEGLAAHGAADGERLEIDASTGRRQ